MDALAFIFDALSRARKLIADELGQPEDRRRRCSAAQLCRSFVSLAEETFGSEYVTALRSWRLENSERLGKIVYELVKWGLIRRQYPDEKSDFDGQFDFSAPSEAIVSPAVFHYPIDRLPKVIDPYRFSLRMVLITITIVAILLGIVFRPK